MSEFHVRFEDGAIYGGTTTRDGEEWKKCTDVTNEALAAVRDYLRANRPDDTEQIGWKWEKRDGGEISVVLVETWPVEEEEEEEEWADVMAYPLADVTAPAEGESEQPEEGAQE